MVKLYYQSDATCDRDSIIELFGATFAASEGPTEGAAIARLVRNLLVWTPSDEIAVFCAGKPGEEGSGCIIFTRLEYRNAPAAVYLMAPVAVRPEEQGRGVGQALIAHGISEMRRKRADVIVTYGDPGFYSRSGFRRAIIADVPAPLPLSLPHGWQAIDLGKVPSLPLAPPCDCVEAFDDPSFW